MIIEANIVPDEYVHSAIRRLQTKIREQRAQSLQQTKKSYFFVSFQKILWHDKSTTCVLHMELQPKWKKSQSIDWFQLKGVDCIWDTHFQPARLRSVP